MGPGVASHRWQLKKKKGKAASCASSMAWHLAIIGIWQFASHPSRSPLAVVA
jgi:hypothetical protein